MSADKSIAVVGSGYVGTVVAACLADLGHQVLGVEVDTDKLESLNKGIPPFFEKGLEERLASAVGAGRLHFTDDYDAAMAASEIVFLCVDTPPTDSGRPDMRSVESAAKSIGAAMREPLVIVTKSTVPVGSGDWLETTIAAALPEGSDESMICVVSNPEFLREGSAVHDFLHPDRVVIGGDCAASVDKVAAVYTPILEQSFSGGDPQQLPVLLTTGRMTAETIKYAANAFLATKISFINEIAGICDELGADVTEVADAIGLDSRIGHAFLNAGAGWGGSCFGKDTAALASMARDRGVEPLILDAVRDVNIRQRELIVGKLDRQLAGLSGRRVAVLGLAFKPGTDDLRDAPAITIVEMLTEKGAIVRACDPMVDRVPALPDIEVFADPFEAIREADAVLLVTEWPEFVELDFVKVAERMRGDVVIDGRNSFERSAVEDAGLRYVGVGRAATAS